MTGLTPAPSPGHPDGDDLTARIFRALYQAYDLHSVAGIHIAVPAGSPCFTGPSLGAIARQISNHEHPAPPAGSAMTSSRRPQLRTTTTGLPRPPRVGPRTGGRPP